MTKNYLCDPKEVRKKKDRNQRELGIELQTSSPAACELHR